MRYLIRSPFRLVTTDNTNAVEALKKQTSLLQDDHDFWANTYITLHLKCLKKKQSYKEGGEKCKGFCLRMQFFSLLSLSPIFPYRLTHNLFLCARYKTRTVVVCKYHKDIYMHISHWFGFSILLPFRACIYHNIFLKARESPRATTTTPYRALRTHFLPRFSRAQFFYFALLYVYAL